MFGPASISDDSDESDRCLAEHPSPEVWTSMHRLASRRPLRAPRLVASVLQRSTLPPGDPRSKSPRASPETLRSTVLPVTPASAGEEAEAQQASAADSGSFWEDAYLRRNVGILVGSQTLLNVGVSQIVPVRGRGGHAVHAHSAHSHTTRSPRPPCTRTPRDARRVRCRSFRSSRSRWVWAPPESAC